MAIAPITGRLARSIRFDLVGSLSLALLCGTAYWKYYAVPTQDTIKDFYVKLEAQKKLKEDA